MQLSPKHTYRDAAFVLRTQQLGDSDKIVILLCQKYGLVHVVAKSARKSKSRFGARLEPLMLLDVGFVYKESLSLLNQGVTKQAYTMPLMAHYRNFLAASLLCEVIEKFAKFGEYERFYFDLLHGAIATLAKERQDAVDVLNAFILRLAHHAGWGVDLGQLAVSLGLEGERALELRLYCQALLTSDWVSIAERDFGFLPLSVFSEVTDHLRSVLDVDFLTLPLIKKEIFGGR